MAAKNYRSVGRWPASFTLLKKEFGRFGGREESWLFGRGCFALFGRRGDRRKRGRLGQGGFAGRKERKRLGCIGARRQNAPPTGGPKI